MTQNQSIEAHDLSATFVKILREWLTPSDFADMRRRNAAETDKTICHSHDFCDANMAMFAAFERTFGREPDVFDQDGNEGPDVALWNAAWNLAALSLRAR